jgi:hypothetical protein
MYIEDEWQIPNIPSQTLIYSGALFNPKKKNVYIKKAGMGTHHKKYKANKSLRTQVTKEHNNHGDTTNTLIKLKTIN